MGSIKKNNNSRPTQDQFLGGLNPPPPVSFPRSESVSQVYSLNKDERKEPK